MKLFLGIDGGQSGTTALVGDESGKIVGVGHAGPCNHVGKAEGRARFLGAIGGCLAGANPTGAEFEAACLGLSGGPEDKEALSRELIRAKHYRITHDAMIALAGATTGVAGVICIAGTGSIAFGRNASGQTARAGGWGYIFGDEGGGFDLVRQALRAALRNEEGWGPPTALKDALLEATGASSVNDLLHRFYTDDYPRARIATLAKLVDEAAQVGDPVASELLKTAAHQLATLVSSVRGRLFESAQAAEISYTGGVFRSQVVLERFRLLVELEEGNRLIAPQHGPAAGALLEAYRMAGLECSLSNLPPEK